VKPERSRARGRLNPRIARLVKREERLGISVDTDTGIDIVDAYRDVDNQPEEGILGKLVRSKVEISQIASAGSSPSSADNSSRIIRCLYTREQRSYRAHVAR